jgi:DNA repair exonuclease SbcCD nuclease subunit
MSKTPYGIVSDIHLHNWSAFSSILSTGENERLMLVLQALESSAHEMHREGCKRMYIAGDLFHVRGKITPSVLNPTLAAFKRIVKLLDVRIIPGNHDLESNDSCELTNATQALAALGCTVITKPTQFFDDDVYMVPWEAHLGELKKKLKVGWEEHQPETAIIHAPLNGVIPGIPDHGLDDKELASLGFDFIFSGHYHNRVDFGNGVWSIGALTHQTWSDVNTGAGYLIVYGDRKIRALESDAPKFVDLDDSMTNAQAKTVCAGNYVRVKLGEASEKDIQEVRERVKSEYDAKSVIVHAQPKRTTSERTSTVKAGASLEASVHEYIAGSETTVDKKALSKECAAVLAESETGEED